MATKLTNAELNAMLRTIRDKLGFQTASRLLEHLKYKETLIQEQKKRIEELAGYLKSTREAFVNLQDQSDQMKRARSFFEDLTKEYGLITDIFFDEEEEGQIEEIEPEA